MPHFVYPVVLHTDDGVHYGITVPDLPGCFSAGDGVQDALQSVLEAIALYMEDLIEPPLPGSITQHQANPDFADGVWMTVDVDLPKMITDT